MEEVQKKKQSPITDYEGQVLLELVEKFKDIVECKKTNHHFNVDKERAWENIAQMFNENCFASKRTAKQLLECYRHMKKATRKAVADIREDIRTAGGRCIPKRKLTTVEEKIISLGVLTVPPDTPYDSIVKGLPTSHNGSNTHDSDEMPAQDLPLIRIFTAEDTPFRSTSTTSVGDSTKFMPSTNSASSSQACNAIVETEHSRKRAIEAESSEKLKLLKQEQRLGKEEHEQKMKIMHEEHLAKLKLMNAQIEYYIRLKQKSNSNISEDSS